MVLSSMLAPDKTNGEVAICAADKKGKLAARGNKPRKRLGMTDNRSLFAAALPIGNLNLS